MNKSDKTFEEKQNESLPPNISWPDVLEEKLTPSEDTTGKWVASTTSFERKGLRFGMDSSPASAEVKGSRQAEERETEKRKRQNRVERKRWESRVRQQQEKESMQNRSPKSRNTDVGGDGSLPAHAVATGSPDEPDCMEAWKDDCRSKRSLSIFTALQTEKQITPLQTPPFCAKAW